MEKLYITEEIAGHPANEGKGLVVGTELEIDENSSLARCAQTDPPCPGHWVVIGGVCVCNPAP